MSLIWRSAAERLGLRLTTGPRVRLYGVGGESRVDGTFVEELQVGKLTIKDQRLPVAGDAPSGIDFVLGENFLGRHSMEFDIPHHVIRTMETSGCTPDQLPYWTKTYSMAELIASPRDAQAIWVDVRLNGRTVRAQIDSGASVSIVSKSVTDSAGVHYVSTDYALVGIGRHALETWIADVQSFAIGDESINNTQLRVARMDKYRTTLRIGSRIPVAAVNGPDMLLGMDFLRVHRVLIDNATRKMVFTYEGGPVFQLTEANAASSEPATGAAPARD